MGFNSSDTAAYKKAAQHFVLTPSVALDLQHHISKIEITRPGAFPHDAEVLYGAIQALDRFHGDGDNTTVWLSIEASLREVPEYVAPALNKLNAYGVGLVITHGDACSHDGTLNGDFLAPLKTALRQGQVFNPLRGQLVDASID